MRALEFALKSLVRDRRAGELRLITAAVVIAVAAYTCAGLFTDRVRRAMEIQATELLAADLVLESAEPVPPDIVAAAAARHLATARSVEFRSMVTAGEQLQLGEVKAVNSAYPLRGILRIADRLFGAERAAPGIPARGTVWLDPRLMQSLGVQVGDHVGLGTSQFTVAAVLAFEPDRGGDLFNIAPRLMMNLADLPATRLIMPGSRASYRLMLRGSVADIEAFRNHVAARAQAGLKVLGIRDARPELRSALERAEQFLGLAVLVAIALCGLAIALASRRFALRHYDNCAVLRCLGATQSFLSRVFLYQLIILAVLASLMGCLIGSLCQEGLAWLLRGMTSRPLPFPSLLPFAGGLAAGCAALTGFAMPWIWRLRSISPLRVFRRELEPLPPRGLTLYGAAVLTLACLLPWQAGEYRLTLFFFAGLLVTAALLAAGAWLAVRLSRRFRGGLGVAWRFGIASLSRRARGSVAQIIGIGLGATAIILLTLIRTDLLDAWENRLPPETPNYFLVNIQPDQVTALGSFLAAHGTPGAALYPMVRARLVRINNRAVSPDDFEDPRARRLATREFNLSWMDRLQQDNRIISGAWWPARPAGRVYFSFEEEIARTLHIGIGDRLAYRIADRKVEGVVRSIRKVDWDTFNANFFVIANPGALESFPATYITSFYLQDARREMLNDLVKRFPSVTVIDVAALMKQVRAIMNQVVRTVEFVFLFTLAAGVIVLLAALQTTHDERRQENALLRSLGASRRHVILSLCAEFTVLGAITGLLAAGAATGIEWLLARQVFDLTFRADPGAWIAGPAACILIIVVAGWFNTRPTLSVPAVVALRQAS